MTSFLRRAGRKRALAMAAVLAASLVWMSMQLTVIEAWTWPWMAAMNGEGRNEWIDCMVHAVLACGSFAALATSAAAAHFAASGLLGRNGRRALSAACVALAGALACAPPLLWLDCEFLLEGRWLGGLSFYAPAAVPLAASLAVSAAKGRRPSAPVAGKAWRWACPALCVLLCNCQAEADLSVRLGYVALETALWAFLGGLAAAVSGRAWVGQCVSFVASWAVGLANFELLSWRGDYVSPADVSAIGTALNVADRYRFAAGPPAVAGFLACCLACAASWLLRESLPAMRRRAPACCLCLAGLAAFGTGAVCPGWMGYFDFNASAKEYGIPLNYLFVASESGDFSIDGYSPKLAEEAVTSVAAGTRPGTRSPVVICIQNESWCDLGVYGNYHVEPDPFANFKALSGNVRKGLLVAPTVNGPTAEAEFEFLTGLSMAFEPGRNPMLGAVGDHPVLSMASVLKAQPEPYRTVMFHPYLSSGYDRETDYPNLGFDETVFYDTWDGKDEFRDLVSDRQCYEDVIAMYEEHRASSDAPLFLFAITIQNHGGYWPGDVESGTMPGVPSVGTGVDDIDMFSALLKETDDALPMLTDYFGRCGEDVVICMYGDHQPYLSVLDQFEAIADPSLGIGPEDRDAFERRAVPYFIWANFDIGAHDGYRDGGRSADRDATSLNYLGAEVLDAAGVSLPAYHRYLLGLHGSFPVFTGGYVVGRDGARYGTGELPDGPAAGYGMVYYNYLYDTEGRLDRLYLP